MYSVAFAMTVIVGIAVTNLFLGFAAALLVGRGPKRWADLDRVIEFRSLSFPRLRRRRGTAKATSTAPAGNVPADASAGVRNSAAGPVGVGGAGAPIDDTAGGVTPTVAAGARNPEEKLVLLPKVEAASPADESPEDVLSHQLDAWRVGVDQEETPSVSGVWLKLADEGLDRQTGDLLLDAVYARVAGQLRRDRRVLRFGDNVFAWFSVDVPPDDALLPLDRIRQILEKTRFLAEGTAICFSVRAAIVAGDHEDTAETIMTRLRATLQYALEKAEGPICIDVGDGPGFVEPTHLDVEPSECELIVRPAEAAQA